MGDFCTAMEKVGIPLREDQVAWLFQQFDLHRDGELDFDEFTRMLTAWRRSELSAGGEGPSSPVGFKEEGRTEDKTLVSGERKEGTSLFPFPSMPRRLGVLVILGPCLLDGGCGSYRGRSR